MSCRLVCAAAVMAGLAAAQPAITSAVNNASYTLPDLPNGGLARGSMAAVFGTGIAGAGTQLATSWPLQTTMGGTSAKITVGGTTVDALMAYTTPNQIGIIVPSSTPEGSGTMTVTYNGQATRALNVRVVKSAFGAFTVNQQGSGPASAENASQKGLVALNKPARPGDVIVLWGTGLGPTTQNEAAGPVPGDLPMDVEVYVGGKKAAVSYKGRSGCCAGIDQVAFTVPSDVAEGCSVPVVVKTGDVVSNFSTIAVARSGDFCVDPTLSSQDWQTLTAKGSYNLGTVSLSRSVIKLSIPGIGNVDSNTDTGYAGFTRVDLTNVNAGAALNVANQQSVAMGACVVNTYQLRDDGTVPTGGSLRWLDAGPAINVNGPKGAKQLTRQGQTGSYSAQLGGGINIPNLPGGISIPGVGQGTPYLDAGSYRIDNGPGGSGPDAVGAFSTSLTLAQPLTWANMDAITQVTRSAGQEVTWSGGQSGSNVYIMGSTINQGAKLYASFVCQERADAGRFTIPSYVLLALPASVPGSGGAVTDTLGVMSMSAPVRFTASGLDAAYVTSSAVSIKNVPYR